MEQLTDFPTNSKTEKVIKDTSGKLRIRKVAVNANNNLVYRYYLPKTKADRLAIKRSANPITLNVHKD